MTDGLAADVAEAVVAMRDGDDGTVINALVQLALHPPEQLLARLADELAPRAIDHDPAQPIGAQDTAGRLPDDATVAELRAAIAAGDRDRLQALAGGSYDGLVVLLVGALARLTTSAAVTSVPLADIDDGSDGDDDGFTPDELAWALDSLNRIVAPAVRLGKDATYCSQRDSDEGLSGERSYASVHRAFYGPDPAIQVARTEAGRLEAVAGGRWVRVARQMGISELPAMVR